MVLGNEAMLTQILSNLIGNAVKFVSPGTRPHVRISARESETRATVFVKDNGIGIEPRHLDQIWQIFQQIEKGFGGTGIGLAIVKKAVERMGGSVGLESTPGQGSTFWFELQRG